jgi:ABC-type polysaccharide/polyol phosphate transport system ATPase subunit
MDAVIRVENLSKKYILQHQVGGRHRYASLRDELAHGFSSLLKKRPEEDARREEFWALRDVSFEIKQGEAVGIIGRNGAGKSTLLKILSRITKPTKGRIEIEGHVASLLEVGTGFHPELTGRENIFLNGAILGMPRADIKKKFDEIVAFAEVEKFLDTPVKRYSSGMYMRLAFAVAAHLDPEILIVDEVLAVGDAQFQKKCLGKMGEVTKGGVTVIFVSHNLPAIATLTGQAIYLAGGKLQLKGQTSDVIKQYLADGEDNNLVYSARQTETISRPVISSVKVITTLPGNIQVCNSSFSIEVTVKTPEPIPRACITVQIYDSEQVNQVNVWNHDTKLTVNDGLATYRLTCQIPQFRLYMGNYRLRVFFTEPPGGLTFQTIEGICPFEVIMENNSRLFQWWPKECAYLEDCEWKVSRQENESQ